MTGSTSSAIERVTGRAVVLRGADIDTDRIMPARFLKAVSFEGLERNLFADDRKADLARALPHPLDAPEAAGSTVLIVNSNFGCGSSREHAPQALLRWGFRAIIGESFGEIFEGNALAIGLVCVTTQPEVMAQMMHAVENDPKAELTVDIRECLATVNDGREWPITLPGAAQQALLSGEWDATGLLLADYFEVERVEARLPYLRATSRNA